MKSRKPKNPWKRVLDNAKAGQEFNRRHREAGIERTVRDFFCDEGDLERIFEEQGRKSYTFGVPLEPMDVFRRNYPLAPSLDRLDNDKDYTLDNICINSRFENHGFNRANKETRLEVKIKFVEAIKSKEYEFNGGPFQRDYTGDPYSQD